MLFLFQFISSFASSLVPFFCFPLCSFSTPPLNRTAVLAGYHAWSIPCYHREINYLDQAAGERGNNERMLLLPRRWPWSLNMNLSLAEEIYGARCRPEFMLSVQKKFTAWLQVQPKSVTGCHTDDCVLKLSQWLDYFRLWKWVILIWMQLKQRCHNLPSCTTI